MPVNDTRAVEVVRRELAANTVARKDPDAKAPHLAGHMAEHKVIVVEFYPEHGVGQGLDHLTVEFNFVFFWHAHTSDTGSDLPSETVRPRGSYAIKLAALKAR
jgi:hypothetical protein